MRISDRVDGGGVHTRIIAAYLVTTALVEACVFVVPAAGAAPVWLAIGLVSAGAIAVGVRRHRPTRTTPWRFLAAVVLVMAMGDAAYALDGERDGGWAVLAEVAYLAMFPLVAAGLLALTGASVVLRDRSRLLSGLTFACSLTLVAWVYLVGPGLRSGALSGADGSAMVAYVVGDVVLLITAVHLVAVRRRSWALTALAIGAAGVLISDVWYLLGQVNGAGWQAGGPGELGYLALYAAWGAAALHPSMVELTTPVETGPARLSRRRLGLLAVSLALPCLTLLAESSAGRLTDGPLIAILTGLICLVAFTQLVDAVNRQRQGAARERELRRACTALVAATHRDEVTAALSAATIRLLPIGTGYAMAGLLTTGPPVVPDPEQAGRRTTLTPVSDLPAPLRTALAVHEYALSCPLLVDLGPGRRGAAQWVVAGHPAVLAAARDTFEVLAAQAALALERIELTEAMHRRDNERYLRTVIETTSDVVLVVDAQEHIQYASRSMGRVLGIDPPVSGLLADIVHPGDHPQMRETRERAEGAGEVGAYGCWSLRRNDGSPVIVEVNYRDLRGDQMVRGFVLTMRDVTERRQREAEVTRRALEAMPAGQNRQSANRKFR